ncbi:BlaI/MecI/CopY family transcriptional regulator [Streptomyces sp. NBC_01591]|uniref:BlaI/MecI/CopY family transcriptional regulator n=1 Tax=Streptomyces sp. NBC_01591 TaxID=2975888 RepID=UPI002DDA73B4|nr:BlaI/MecI/CopY family transcriptional regulator [Streptomyces sp. NBC_01591]
MIWSRCASTKEGRGTRRLGELEAEIMDCLWKWDRPATVREVVDAISLRRPAAYTTVMTVATILFMPLARHMREQIPLLLEMAADDHALRHCSRHTLAAAMFTMASSEALQGALAAGGCPYLFRQPCQGRFVGVGAGFWERPAKRDVPGGSGA